MQVVLKPVPQTYNVEETTKVTLKPLQTFSSSMSTMETQNSAGEETSTLEQRMLKQHMSQRTVEKRTVTVTTHQQLKSYQLKES